MRMSPRREEGATSCSVAVAVTGGRIRQYIAPHHDATRKTARVAAMPANRHGSRLPMGSAADAPHGSRPEQVYRASARPDRAGAARAGQPHRRNRDRHATRRESHAGARSAAAAAAGRLRHGVTGRAAVATHGGAAHARRRVRAAQHRRRARRAWARAAPRSLPHERSAQSGARPQDAERRIPSRRARRRRSITAACTTPTSDFTVASSKRAPGRGCSRCTTR